jgi:hypothetical protein
MNAYFASFMLLLFNAVGLSVPASAAEETRLASSAEATISARCLDSQLNDTNVLFVRDDANALNLLTTNCSRSTSTRLKPSEAFAVSYWDAGDKLEHHEGAP